MLASCYITIGRKTIIIGKIQVFISSNFLVVAVVSRKLKQMPQSHLPKWEIKGCWGRKEGTW